MARAPGEDRIEQSSKAVLGILYSFIGLALLVVCFFGVKIIQDEVHQGYERSLVLPEHRVSSDLSESPPANLLQVADGLENKPYRLRTDKDGFIIPSAVHEKPDGSIVFIGGSTTECHYMDEDLRFPYLVGRNLESTLGKRINSYNSGCADNNTLHSVLLLQGKVISMRPRIAVLMECINDLTFLTIFGDYWGPNATRYIVQDKEYNPFKRWIIEHLIGHKAVKVNTAEFIGAQGPAADLSPEAMSSKFRNNIELFVFLCRQQNITPVLMTQFNRFSEDLAPNLQEQFQPVFTSWGSYEQYRTCYNALNDTTRQVAKEQNVLLIDLDRLVPKTKSYMYDVVHLNAEGSRFVADIVTKALESELRK